MNHSRFKDIKFPFYGKVNWYYDILYRQNVIYGKQFVHSKSYKIIDQVSEENKAQNYIQRLASIDNRIEFDCTCRNITELIAAKPKWGIDSEGKIFILTRKERLKTKILPIRKKKPGLIWLNSISYPFEIDRTINVEAIDTNALRAQIILVDSLWVLYKFTYELSTAETILV